MAYYAVRRKQSFFLKKKTEQLITITAYLYVCLVFCIYIREHLSHDCDTRTHKYFLKIDLNGFLNSSWFCFNLMSLCNDGYRTYYGITENYLPLLPSGFSYQSTKFYHSYQITIPSSKLSLTSNTFMSSLHSGNSCAALCTFFWRSEIGRRTVRGRLKMSVLSGTYTTVLCRTYKNVLLRPH